MPSCGVAVEVPQFFPVGQIGMIGYNSERRARAPKVVLPVFQGFDDGQ